MCEWRSDVQEPKIRHPTLYQERSKRPVRIPTTMTLNIHHPANNFTNTLSYQLGVRSIFPIGIFFWQTGSTEDMATPAVDLDAQGQLAAE